MDFFVIVPAEYHSLGAPPSAWYLEGLFAHLTLPYYLGGISAAQWHGATHFASQETQVVTIRQLRPIQVGRESIRFLTKRSAGKSAIETRRTDHGEIRISTPETTALDLMRYSTAAGGLNAIATALTELKPQLKRRALAKVLEQEGTPVHAQRLGYIFEKLGARQLATPMREWLKTKRVRLNPLDPDGPLERGNIDERWHLRVNAPIEPAL